MAEELTVIELVLGISLGVIAASFFSLGAIFQKKGVMDIPELQLSDAQSMKEMVKSRIWIIGLVLGVSGGPMYMLSQAYIGVTLAQPLMGTGMIFTVIAGIKLFQENLSTFEYLGIGVIIIAPILLALGNVTKVSINLLSIEFILGCLIYYIPCIIATVLCLIGAKKSEKLAVPFYALVSGIMFGMGAVSSQIGVEAIKLWQFPEILIGIIFLIGFAVGNAYGTLVIQLAFQKGKIITATPIQSAGNLILPIVGGVLIFNQIILVPIFFYFGVVLILAGNFMLVRVQAKIEEMSTSVEEIDEKKK